MGDSSLEPDSRPENDPGEQAIIDVLLASAGIRAGEVSVGPGDDAAVLASRTAVTVDTLVEGVHWNERLRASDVGYKTLAVSVSDLAAMGAVPRWMLLAISLPSPLDLDWVREFAEGLGEAARRWDVGLVGGDTTRTHGPRVVSATVAGRCVGAPLLRSGGKPGDDVYVTGIPGLAGVGWMEDDPPEAALVALRRPDPPLDFALEVAKEGLATAAMDLSDGLAADLPRLCAASGTGASIDPNAFPSHPAFGAVADPIRAQTRGGDDYQLLLTANPQSSARLHVLAEATGTRLTRIGTLTAEPAVSMTGRPWPQERFAHFGGPS